MDKMDADEVHHGHKEPHWALTIFDPLKHLTKQQGFVLGATAFATTALVALSHVVMSRLPDVFYTESIATAGPGQLAGMFFAYFTILLAAVLRLHNPFDNDFANITNAAAEFGAYMILFFVSDRTTIIPRAEKRKDMKLFWTLWFLLIAAALCTLRKAKAPAAPAAPSAAAVEEGATTSSTSASASASALVGNNQNGIFHVKHLQRDQTEEWKGWMQVMFLWYHYFNATSIYNVIRLYIAAYVWMTGFGNFSYYYIKKDFSVGRFVAMQWRLNFMVTWVCAILGNEYMLYYICPLHTVFTLMIYFGLGIKNSLNYTRWGLVGKFVGLFVIAVVMWDVKGVFTLVWSPLKFLLQYNDPYNPTRPALSEWEFRTYLDHLVWIVGMFMACNHPRFDVWLERLDSLPRAKSNAIKGAVVAGVLIAGYAYYESILSLPKKEYNKIHPYTSFIPIILFIILRNIFTVARQYHLHLFEFLGKTTLETYIAQFHIWMATTGINGSPKKLLRILPEDWFITNFVVMSVIFFFVSYRLFQCTNAIRPLLVPSKASDDTVKRNVVLGAFLVASVYVLCMFL